MTPEPSPYPAYGASVGMNRATGILAEWDSRVGTSPAGLLEQQRDSELAELRRELRKSREECHRLQN